MHVRTEQGYEHLLEQHMLETGVQEGGTGLLFSCVNYERSHYIHCKSMLCLGLFAFPEVRASDGSFCLGCRFVGTVQMVPHYSVMAISDTKRGLTAPQTRSPRFGDKELPRRGLAAMHCQLKQGSSKTG